MEKPNLTETVVVMGDAIRQWDDESKSGHMPYMLCGADMINGEGNKLGEIGATPEGAIWLKAHGGKWWRIDPVQFFVNFLESKAMYLNERR